MKSWNYGINSLYKTASEDTPEIFKDDKIGNQEVLYGIEFTDWEEWLETDIIAHCLCEMSF